MLKRIFTDRRGTALLVALLVMAVLIAVSLLLSSLILRETRITKEFIDAGRAYYAAESGVELALYGLNNNLPGWEPGESEDGYQFFQVDDELMAVGELKVDNRCGAYPCFEEGFEYEAGHVPLKEFYDVLDLNRSITIPLFVVEENGEVKNADDFVVEFFATFDPRSDLNFSEDFDHRGFLSGWDVLRWKVFGIKEGHTETIGDFTALSMANFQSGVDEEEVIANNAKIPAWFGTASCSKDFDQGGRYNSGIDCLPYYIPGQTGEIAVDTEQFGQVAKIQAGTCSQVEAREYYQYEYFGDDRDVSSIYGCYSIKTFLDQHTLNYLSLTNLINPGIFKEQNRFNEAFQKLYFRVELFSDSSKEAETVREFADITSNGYSGDSKQSINVKIRKDSFMPVFHFSLYSTYMDEDGGHDEEYWYGEE